MLGEIFPTCTFNTGVVERKYSSGPSSNINTQAASDYCQGFQRLLKVSLFVRWGQGFCTDIRMRRRTEHHLVTCGLHPPLPFARDDDNDVACDNIQNHTDGLRRRSSLCCRRDNVSKCRQHERLAVKDQTPSIR